MATTWTCSSGHTHDLSKLARGLEPDATPGVECKTSGDRVTAMDYGTPSTVAPVKKWTASTRLQASA